MSEHYEAFKKGYTKGRLAVTDDYIREETERRMTDQEKQRFTQAKEDFEKIYNILFPEAQKWIGTYIDEILAKAARQRAVCYELGFTDVHNLILKDSDE